MPPPWDNKQVEDEAKLDGVDAPGKTCGCATMEPCAKRDWTVLLGDKTMTEETKKVLLSTYFDTTKMETPAYACAENQFCRVRDDKNVDEKTKKLLFDAFVLADKQHKPTEETPVGATPVGALARTARTPFEFIASLPPVEHTKQFGKITTCLKEKRGQMKYTVSFRYDGKADGHETTGEERTFIAICKRGPPEAQIIKIEMHVINFDLWPLSDLVIDLSTSNYTKMVVKDCVFPIKFPQTLQCLDFTGPIPPELASTDVLPNLTKLNVKLEDTLEQRNLFEWLISFPKLSDLNLRLRDGMDFTLDDVKDKLESHPEILHVWVMDYEHPPAAFTSTSKLFFTTPVGACEDSLS
jgi:hypothetical protein